jgi:hypothetical protein
MEGGLRPAVSQRNFRLFLLVNSCSPGSTACQTIHVQKALTPRPSPASSRYFRPRLVQCWPNNHSLLLPPSVGLLPSKVTRTPLVGSFSSSSSPNFAEFRLPSNNCHSASSPPPRYFRLQRIATWQTSRSFTPLTEPSSSSHLTNFSSRET